MNQKFNAKLANIELGDIKEDFQALLKRHSRISNKKEGDIVTGTITNIDEDFVTVDIGFKDVGRIAIQEFMKNSKLADIAVGDEVEVCINSFEKDSQLVLSRTRAIKRASWSKLEGAMKEKESVVGVIVGKIKGGLVVNLDGVVAFLPGSQVNSKQMKDISGLIGVEQPFVVLKMDSVQGNVVVSRKGVIDEARDEALSKMAVGDVREGVVKNLTNYGAFVSLGEIDGLLYVTDIRWTKINHPSEVLSVGQKVKVQIIKYDREAKRISLGMKQLEQNPWEKLSNEYPLKTKMKGKVTNVADYGVFVELKPGIEGLVHTSEIAWNKENSLSAKIKVGDVVEFMILEIDSDKHRISLSIKRCQDSIWTKLNEKYPAGTVVSGTVDKILDHGLQINIGEEVSGLVAAEDISWSEDASEAIKGFNVGDAINAAVLGVHLNKERVSLSIKNLSTNPFEAVAAGLKKGSVVTCIVKSIERDGIHVTLEGNNFATFIKKSDLSNDKIEQRPDRFAIGDRIDAQAILVDRKNKKLTLSVKALEKVEQQKAIEKYGSTSSGASLSGILGQAISGVPVGEK